MVSYASLNDCIKNRILCNALTLMTVFQAMLTTTEASLRASAPISVARSTRIRIRIRSSGDPTSRGSTCAQASLRQGPE